MCVCMPACAYVRVRCVRTDEEDGVRCGAVPGGGGGGKDPTGCTKVTPNLTASMRMNVPRQLGEQGGHRNCGGAHL